jgi:hypothetical protein
MFGVLPPLCRPIFVFTGAKFRLLLHGCLIPYLPPSCVPLHSYAISSFWLDQYENRRKQSTWFPPHRHLFPLPLPLPPHCLSACQGGARFLMFTSTENDVNLAFRVADVKWSVCLVGPPKFTNVPIKLTPVRLTLCLFRLSVRNFNF